MHDGVRHPNPRVRFDSIDPREAANEVHWTPAMVYHKGNDALVVDTSAEVWVRRAACGAGCMCAAEFTYTDPTKE